MKTMSSEPGGPSPGVPGKDDGGRPRLLEGHHEQPAWSVHDASGRVFLLHRVYGATHTSRRHPGVVSVGTLDQDRSYWLETDPEGGSLDREKEGRWVTFARARVLRGGRLTFNKFISREDMRADLGRLVEEAAKPAT